MRPDPIGSLLVIVELTALRERVPATNMDRWAIDCARRAIGAENPRLRTAVAGLRTDLAAARAWLRVRDQPKTDELARDGFETAHRQVAALSAELSRGRSYHELRAHAAALSVEHMFACVAGQPDYEAVARAAQAAFVVEDRAAEAQAQARRLLLRAKLMPSGGELLVRLDYAESSGLLPTDPASRAWLDAHRQLLMAEDEDGRFAVTLRYLDQVFAMELDGA